MEDVLLSRIELISINIEKVTTLLKDMQDTTGKGKSVITLSKEVYPLLVQIYLATEVLGLSCVIPEWWSGYLTEMQEVYGLGSRLDELIELAQELEGTDRKS